MCVIKKNPPRPILVLRGLGSSIERDSGVSRRGFSGRMQFLATRLHRILAGVSTAQRVGYISVCLAVAAQGWYLQGAPPCLHLLPGRLFVPSKWWVDSDNSCIVLLILLRLPGSSGPNSWPQCGNSQRHVAAPFLIHHCLFLHGTWLPLTIGHP